MHTIACMMRSEDNSVESIFSFQLYMAFGEQTQVTRLIQQTHLTTESSRQPQSEHFVLL